MIAAVVRHTFWRLVIAGAGGLRVDGQLPGQPCVLVANHSSHADTAALIAALPARRRPVSAAAADYWFKRPVRAAICRTLAGAFPVRRDGGGSADLASAAAMLAAGSDVIVYPEGTRTRDGSIGRFHSGAERLARQAGAPLVPVGIVGTRDLLPVHGRLRRGRVAVRVGAPAPDIAAARAAVAELAAAPTRHRDHRRKART
jgi:1-acyl-sn-glycerol-3-phosphate acyltransferase